MIDWLKILADSKEVNKLIEEGRTSEIKVAGHTLKFVDVKDPILCPQCNSESVLVQGQIYCFKCSNL